MCHVLKLYATDVNLGVEDINGSYYEIRIDVQYKNKKNIIAS